MKDKIETHEGLSPAIQREVRISKIRDALVFIPLFFIFLFLIPWIDAFDPERLLFGLPLKFVIFFLVWAICILTLAVLNHVLRKDLDERKR